MKQSFIDEQKQKLEEEKKSIEKELQKFADKNPKLKGDWDSKFPRFNQEINKHTPEDAADEVEEYANRLPIEYNLEIRLRNINLALEKIEKENYGKCEKCGEEIPQERLKVSPEARLCLKCKE